MRFLVTLALAPTARGGFWSDIGDFFTDVGDGIVDFAEGVVDTVEDIATDVVNNIEDTVVDVSVGGDVAGNIAEGLGYDIKEDEYRDMGNKWEEVLGLPNDVVVDVGNGIEKRAEAVGEVPPL